MCCLLKQVFESYCHWHYTSVFILPNYNFYPLIHSFQIWSVFSTALLVLSLCILVVNSLPEIRNVYFNSLKNSTNGATSSNHVVLAYRVLILSDTVICLVLIMEYLLRFSCCPRKIDFVKCPRMIVSVLSIVPSLVGGVLYFIVRVEFLFMDNVSIQNAINLFLRIRILRVFALLRYDQYYPTLRVIIMTISASRQAIATISFLLLAMSVFFGGCLFYLEWGHIESIPYSMWWAAVTMTTLGYGDVYPTSAAGHLLGVLCVVSGIITLVLPIPVVSMHYDHFTSAMTQFEQLKASFRHGKRPLPYSNTAAENQVYGAVELMNKL